MTLLKPTRRTPRTTRTQRLDEMRLQGRADADTTPCHRSISGLLSTAPQIAARSCHSNRSAEVGLDRVGRKETRWRGLYFKLK
jgi:hypothetical protein